MLALENEIFHFRGELYCQISINILSFSVLVTNLAIFSSLEEEHGKLASPPSPPRNLSYQYES